MKLKDIINQMQFRKGMVAMREKKEIELRDIDFNQSMGLKPR